MDKESNSSQSQSQQERKDVSYLKYLSLIKDLNNVFGL